MIPDAFDKFTEPARQALTDATSVGRRFHPNSVVTMDVLSALLFDRDNLSSRLLQDLNVTVDLARCAVLFLKGCPPIERGTGATGVTPSLQEALRLAVIEAHDLGHSRVSTGHMLLGLVQSELGAAADLLSNLGVRAERLRDSLQRLVTDDGDLEATAGVVTQPTAVQAANSASEDVKPDAFKLLVGAPLSDEYQMDFREPLGVVPIFLNKTVRETTITLLSLESYRRSFVVSMHIHTPYVDLERALFYEPRPVVVGRDELGGIYYGLPSDSVQRGDFRVECDFFPALSGSASELTFNIFGIWWPRYQEAGPIENGLWTFVIDLKRMLRAEGIEG